MTALQEMGCEMAQGFLVGKPSPAEVAESLLGAAPLDMLRQGASPAMAPRA